MARHAGKVLTHAFLLGQVWGPEHLAEVQLPTGVYGRLAAQARGRFGLPRYLLSEPRRRLPIGRPVELGAEPATETNSRLRSVQVLLAMLN